ncbi:type VI secretion system-associated FHA domain protein TagH [Undibacterium sp. TJN19]|uniref:type VI secretion system-associated FHA domain protein TagH n=1 Tax=Undibacterium sp. TJN19 TaxID=3413055 RepID=UPI003BF3C4B7
MIKIAVVSYNNEAPVEPIFAVFAEEQETIGRNTDNFLVLPDPKHFVSRTQAKAWSIAGRHYLMNLSLANPILVNGKEIVAEADHEIHPGDEIQIGVYLLNVDAVQAEETEQAEQTEEATTEASAEPADAVVHTAQVVDIKTNTSTVRVASSKNAAAASEPAVQPPQFLLRPEAEMTTDNGSALQAQAASEENLSSAEAASTVLRQDSKRPADTSKPQASASELMQAFLDGAGLPTLSLSSGLTVELMETLGKFMASSVQGAMEELSQRALLKREVKAEVTMVVLRENNPLKFFPDSKTVLTQMLRKKMPGFMAPAEAMEDAFFDIRAHQLGVAAGMRAVSEALLQQLEPTDIEQLLEAPTLRDHINPARRKAAMWDHFSELFDTVSKGKKEGFQVMFGKEFLSAYEAEVERADLDR